MVRGRPQLLFSFSSKIDRDSFHSFSIFPSRPVPVLIMGWIEAVSCDAGLVHVGGHVWYDAIIPISVLVYSAVALSRPASPSDSRADALAKKAS